MLFESNPAYINPKSGDIYVFFEPHARVNLAHEGDAKEVILLCEQSLSEGAKFNALTTLALKLVEGGVNTVLRHLFSEREKNLLSKKN